MSEDAFVAHRGLPTVLPIIAWRPDMRMRGSYRDSLRDRARGRRRE
jgi:hypothetical protein